MCVHSTVNKCDRQTDRRTDGQTELTKSVACICYQYLSRAGWFSVKMILVAGEDGCCDWDWVELLELLSLCIDICSTAPAQQHV